METPNVGPLPETNSKFAPKNGWLEYVPGTQMTSIFEGQPSKTRPELQAKQGAPFGF